MLPKTNPLDRENYRPQSWLRHGLLCLLLIQGLALLVTVLNMPIFLTSWGPSIITIAARRPDDDIRFVAIFSSHLIGGLVGLLFYFAAGHISWQNVGLGSIPAEPPFWMLGPAGVAAYLVMRITKFFHPPALANAVILLSASADWTHFVGAVVAGALLIGGYAHFTGRVHPPRRIHPSRA